MTELERVVAGPVSRETIEKLEAYAAMVRQENQRQNLVSRAATADFWDRHILDSAQLVRFNPKGSASWADIGSGAGMPGVVIACLVDGPVTLIEPRRMRADFLHRVCDSLRLNATVEAKRVEYAEGEYDIITARAVGSITMLLKISQHLSTKNTVWVLPKGRTPEAELAEARASWQGVFHVEQSVTDSDSKIAVATRVRMKK